MTDQPLESAPQLVRLKKRLGRIRRKFALDTYDIFAKQVGAGHEEFEPPPAYRFAWATAEDVERCNPYHTELDAQERREGVDRLGLDHRAVFAFYAQTPVFTMWMNPRNIHVPGILKRRLGPGQVFIYKAFTSPDHRGKSLYKAGMAFVLSYLARKGMAELVGYAHVKKTISRKGLAALDFDSRGRFHHLQVPGWQHTFVSRELAENFPEALAPSENVLKAQKTISSRSA